ncbi:MAG: DUF2252 family protein [Cyanobacteria bacterium P01_F01_bin.150]
MSHRSRIVLEALKQHNANLTREERASKYGKMAQSPFRFYRGTNHLFWSDFSQDKRLQQFSSQRTRIWLQGDLHTENYGAYGNDDGHVVYSLNDFDDSVVADYQFDIWRMAISIVLVARQSITRSFSKKNIEQILEAFVEEYLETLDHHRGQRSEHRLTFTGNVLTEHLNEFLEKVDNRSTLKQFLNQWTILTTDEKNSRKISSKNGTERRRFNYGKLPHKLAPVTKPEWDAIANQMAQYGTTLKGKIDYNPHHFEIQDIAQRINAGTGSLGARRYYVLISDGDKSPLTERILDIKHQMEPTPFLHMKEGDRQTYNQVFGNNHALRHATAYRALTNSTDDYLGWMYLKDLPDHVSGYFSVRELSPYKRSFDATKISTLKIFKDVSKNWGTILATAHSRADKDFDSTFIDYSFDKQVDKIVKNHHDDFCRLVKTIALPYADQVESDWQTFIDSKLINE